MKISRTGSERNHGPSQLALPTPTIEWSNFSGTVEYSFSNVKDFNTPAHHNWCLRFEPEDVARLMLEQVKNLHTKHKDKIVTAFLPHLSSLLEMCSAISDDLNGGNKSRDS